MWFITSWIYKSRYGSLPFKMRNFTESYQAECREDIKKELKVITAKLPHIWTRIKLKDAKQKMHDNFTDILGRSIKVKLPIFTENEIAKYKQHRWLYIGVLFLMILFESILYSMMAALFIGKDTVKDMPGIEIVFGLAFAIIFVAALHFAFKSLWDYFEAQFLIKRDNLSKILLKPFYKNLVIGIVIIAIFIITNIYTGFIRATIFEGSGNSSTSVIMQKLHGPLLVFSIAITFTVALVMALLEKEIVEKSEKYKVFKNWKRQQKERKGYNTQVKEMLSKSIIYKNLMIEKYWGVLKDLQRVFEMEVDVDREDLKNELNTKIANHEIDLANIDDATYQQYLHVATTRFELFEYGIESNKEIIEIIDDLKVKVADIKEFELRNAKINNEINNSEEKNNTDI